jgi:hypothetical protein
MAEGDTFSAVAVGKTSVKVYADQKRGAIASQHGSGPAKHSHRFVGTPSRC